MQLDRTTLLYCAYAIASFDMLCAMLFFAFSFGTFCVHISWLTIFGLCFAIFWLTLIGMLVTGIYWRNTALMGYWIVFSCLGIIIETLLIIYAFLKNTSYNNGLVKNVYSLGLALLIESCFAYIIYQFYLSSSCQCKQVEQDCSQRETCGTHSASSPLTPMQASSRDATSQSRCNILQKRGGTSPYTCGHRRAPDY